MLNPYLRNTDATARQQWRPRMNKPLTEKYLRFYEKEPERFNQEQVQILNQHANYYQLPFRKITEEQADFNIFRAARYVGEGFLQGFTTLKIGEQRPVNAWERVAKAVGQAAGYVGWIPSFGTGTIGRAAARMSGKSLPLYLSGKAMKAVNPMIDKAFGEVVKKVGTAAAVGEAGAVASAFKLLTGGAARNVVKGAVHMGTAGAISNWQEGIDGMLRGFVGGLYMEAGDRIIAEGVAKAIGGAVGGPILAGINNSKWTSQAVTRTLLGSMWNGLPSTLRNETTPDQIYQYLIGGFFAFRDAPTREMDARQIFFKNYNRLDNLKSVSEFEGYKEADAFTRARVLELYNENIGTDAVRSALLQKIGEHLTSNGIEFDEESLNTATDQVTLLVNANKEKLRLYEADLQKTLAEQAEVEKEMADAASKLTTTHTTKLVPSQEESAVNRVQSAAISAVLPEADNKAFADELHKIFIDNFKVDTSEFDIMALSSDLTHLSNTIDLVVSGKLNMSQLLSQELQRQYPTVANQTYKANAIAFDGDSDVSRSVMSATDAKPELKLLVNPDIVTNEHSVAFVPGDAQLSGAEFPSFAKIDSAIKNGATIITPDKIDRVNTAKDYWDAFEKYMDDNGYNEGDGEGIWLKPTISDVKNPRFVESLIRSELKRMAIGAIDDQATTANYAITREF